MIPFLVGAVGLALSGAAAGIVPPEVANAVVNLGAADYEVREAASIRLSEFGPAALPALRAAETSASPERAERARSLVAELTIRAETMRVLAPKLYPVNFRAVGFVEATTEFAKLVGRPIAVDPRIVPSNAKLTLEGNLSYWRIVEAFEEVFDVQYAAIDGDLGTWLPIGVPQRRTTDLGSLRLTTTTTAETASGAIVILNLQPDATRVAVRIQSMRLDAVVGADGAELATRPILVAPLPQPDASRTRFNRGRIFVGNNAVVELNLDAVPSPVPLSQQQIAVPIVWPPECDRIETLAGVLRARVRGAADEQLRIAEFDAGSGSASVGSLSLKITKTKDDSDGRIGFRVATTYQPSETSFAENFDQISPETETILLGGRAMVVQRGQGGVVLNRMRGTVGPTSANAFHGLKLFAAGGAIVPFLVESPALSIQPDGSIVEQFTARILTPDSEKHGTPTGATLHAQVARTISIPFQLKHLPRPKSAP